jgi:DNA-directed RNA polymerase subunit RPC12/RpoP
MKKKMGRPMLSQGAPKSVLIGARFGKDEADKVEEAAGKNKSQWVRSALLDAATDGRIMLRLRCAECSNEVRKLPRQLKPGGATVCPKCGRTFIDEAVLKEAEALAKFLLTCGPGKQ